MAHDRHDSPGEIPAPKMIWLLPGGNGADCLGIAGRIEDDDGPVYAHQIGAEADKPLATLVDFARNLSPFAAKASNDVLVLHPCILPPIPSRRSWPVVAGAT